MFEVVALQRGFMGRQALLRAVGSDTRDKVIADPIEADWLDHLRNYPPLSKGDTIIVNVPAFADLRVGQTLRVH